MKDETMYLCCWSKWMSELIVPVIIFSIIGCSNPVKPDPVYEQGEPSINRSCTDCHENTKTCRPEFIIIDFQGLNSIDGPLYDSIRAENEARIVWNFDLSGGL